MSNGGENRAVALFAEVEQPDGIWVKQRHITHGVLDARLGAHGMTLAVRSNRSRDGGARKAIERHYLVRDVASTGAGAGSQGVVEPLGCDWGELLPVSPR